MNCATAEGGLPDRVPPRKIVVRGLEISPPIALAPMVGLSHSALRSLVGEAGGGGLFYTEMLAAKRLPHDNEKCSPLLVRSENESPLFYQVFTSSHLYVPAAVEKLHRLGAQGIDLNLGCPAPAVKRQKAGASLAEDPGQLKKVLQTLRKATELPISVKIRLGDSGDAVGTSGLCRFLQDEGVDLIGIHARLNGEKFCRRPRWAAIDEIKDAVSVPVFANGGIFTVEDARKCLEISRADGLMIGRGAGENPNLCSEIARDVYGERIGRQRTKAEMYFKFITLLDERFAPERRLGRLKQFTTYFAAPFPFGHHLASAIQSCQSMEQARERAAGFFAGYAGDRTDIVGS